MNIFYFLYDYGMYYSRIIFGFVFAYFFFYKLLFKMAKALALELTAKGSPTSTTDVLVGVTVLVAGASAISKVLKGKK